MSRSEIALPLPFPPTELQVMMGEVATKLLLSRNLNFLSGGCNRARWACREAAGVWDILVVVLQCRSWFHFQFGLWLQPPSFQCGRPRIFWSLPAQPCRAQWETRRLQSAGGLQWVQEKLDWYERTKAYSAFVRSDQSATLASKSAGEAIKGPWGEGVVNAWGGGNLGMGVCKRTVPFFFAPRSLQAEKAKGQGSLPWPFSRGCQTYWEACQKCGGR